MSYSSPESQHKDKQYKCLSSFQCVNYRNMYHECTSHHIRSDVVEAAVLSAIHAVSGHVLEDEDAFVRELMELWAVQSDKAAGEEKKELATAKKRVDELNRIIEKLYEEKLSGSIAKRQCERLINQYDEEQERLESRIEELQTKVDSAAPKRANVTKFLALVRKYKNCEELTDAMLYEFVDKIVIHAPIGGTTVYRQQRIDIYFNFIGEYMPPGEGISEEDRIAAIEQEQREKRMQYEKISAERKKQHRKELKAAAETDLEAAEILRKRKVSEVEKRTSRAERQKKRIAEDPEYAEAIAAQKKEYSRRHSNQRKVEPAELKEAAANGDENAIRKLAERRAYYTEANIRYRNRMYEAAAAGDPEAVAKYEEYLKVRREAARRKKESA